MREVNAQLIFAGHARHGTLVKVDRAKGYFTAEVNFPTRLELGPDEPLYLTARLVACDYVDLENDIITSGEGFFQFTDEQGDEFWADWQVDGIELKGVLEITGGTGKWQGASGSIDVRLRAVPHDNAAHESYVLGIGAGLLSLGP